MEARECLMPAKPYDLAYRPHSYWADVDFDTAILSRIMGEDRKRAVSGLLEQGYKGIAFHPTAAESLAEADRETPRHKDASTRC